MKELYEIEPGRAPRKDENLILHRDWRTMSREEKKAHWAELLSYEMPYLTRVFGVDWFAITPEERRDYQLKLNDYLVEELAEMGEADIDGLSEEELDLARAHMRYEMEYDGCHFNDLILADMSRDPRLGDYVDEWSHDEEDHDPVLAPLHFNKCREYGFVAADETMRAIDGILADPNNVDLNRDTWVAFGEYQHQLRGDRPPVK